MNNYTENVADMMCARERRELRSILTAWELHGLPDDFSDTGVKFVFNRDSGYVFLTNDDYQVVMVNGDVLESFYTTPYNGCEGFWPDLVAEYPSMCAEDQEYMRDIANGRGLPELERGAQ